MSLDNNLYKSYPSNLTFETNNQPVETNPFNSKNYLEQEKEPSKLAKVAYKVLSYSPVTGTIIGIKKAIKAYQLGSDYPCDAWKKAKIITQIFSFLLVPQVIYGIARGIKSFSERSSSSESQANDYFKAMKNSESKDDDRSSQDDNCSTQTSQSSKLTTAQNNLRFT